MLNIIKEANEAELKLALEGRLDTTTAPMVEAIVKDELEGVTSLQFDFEKLEYVSSAGLRVLLASQKAMNAVNGTMVIRNVCDNINEVFEITGFSDILTIEQGTEPAAL